MTSSLSAELVEATTAHLNHSKQKAAWEEKQSTVREAFVAACIEHTVVACVADPIHVVQS